MNLIILGPQGSGKGTQAKMLSEKFGLEHIDMGKYLREVAKLNTPLGKEIYQIQNVTKALVPSRILKEVLHIKLGDLPREKGIAFDGVPRAIDQAKYLEEAMLEFGRIIDRVIYIKLSAEESIRRISKRRVCEKCKAVYILGKDMKSKEEKCRKCGGKIIQRMDDTPEGIRKRLKVFEDETLPVISYFQEKGMVTEINGGQTVEEVFEEILGKLKEVI